MPSYLVETFLARGAADERRHREQQASLAAESLTTAGTHVRFDGSIYVPADEVCFFSFEASTDAVVETVAERAGLAPFRVVEIDSSQEPGLPPIT
jgi:hypothetical protein